MEPRNLSAAFHRVALSSAIVDGAVLTLVLGGMRAGLLIAGCGGQDKLLECRPEEGIAP
jgi:hypothetical protein